MNYRDDEASLEARRDNIQRELADMDRKVEALKTLSGDSDTAARELTAAEARLAHQTARHLPVLDHIRFAAPCAASWEAMKGDDRVRFCGSCQMNVYNLSALPRAEAERLLAEHEESLCVRLYQRADGTVMTNDCPVGVTKRRRRQRAIALAGVAAMAATAAIGVEAMWSMGKPPVAMMGAPAVMGSTAEPVEERVTMAVMGAARVEPQLTTMFLPEPPPAQPPPPRSAEPAQQVKRLAPAPDGAPSWKNGAVF